MKSTRHILLIAILTGGLAGCISGKPQSDTYTNRNGSTVKIESDADMCRHSCNDTYSRCMDGTSASGSNTSAIDPDGIHGLNGVLGASGDCRNALQNCLPACKSQ